MDPIDRHLGFGVKFPSHLFTLASPSPPQGAFHHQANLQIDHAEPPADELFNYLICVNIFQKGKHL